MKKIIFNLVILLTTLSCSLSTKGHRPAKRNTDVYFKGSGVLQYFHQTIPLWANFRQSGKCFLKKRLRHFNFLEMGRNLQMSYTQLSQFQLMYNVYYENEKIKSIHNNEEFQLTFQDQERIFYKTSQNIQSNIFLFKAPRYKRINLVWIDSALENKNDLKRLKKLFKSKSMDLGHPVLISECLTRRELELFTSKNIPNSSNARKVSAEMFSHYNSKNIQDPMFGIDLSMFFSKKQKLYFYTRWGRPQNYKGQFIIKKY